MQCIDYAYRNNILKALKDTLRVDKIRALYMGIAPFLLSEIIFTHSLSFAHDLKTEVNAV
jgi:hypothetical protein